MKIVVKPGGIFTVLLLTGIFGVTITQNLRPASNRERPATRPAAVAATPAPVLSVPVIDLTSEGILDWKVWGVSPSGENANPMLPIGKSHPIETIGPLKYAGQNQYWSQPALRNMVWSDGDPIRKVLRVGTGVFTTGADNRFSFSVPATRKERILRLYVQSKNAETGLTAKLEQGAGRPIVTMKEDVASDGTSSRIYTISFQSDRDRDRMNVVWELKKPTDDAENHLGIQAVSLQ